MKHFYLLFLLLSAFSFGQITAPEELQKDSQTSVIEKTDLKVYPNPVTAGYFYSENSTPGSVSIYDVLGKNVANFEISSGKNRINIPELKNGVYILKFNQQGKTFTKKLVIR
ncbi:MAG: T9SS type A sorting domain-containing protein [Flavobacteriaceae bacterium]|nr:T9SS type A sorting domain-containing protein [Flavobacteriaceae bacterium]